MQVKKQQLELDMEQQTGSKLKGILQGYIFLPCLFNFNVEYTMQNAGLDISQAGVETASRKIWRITEPQICR